MYYFVQLPFASHKVPISYLHSIDLGMEAHITICMLHLKSQPSPPLLRKLHIRRKWLPAHSTSTSPFKSIATTFTYPTCIHSLQSPPHATLRSHPFSGPLSSYSPRLSHRIIFLDSSSLLFLYPGSSILPSFLNLRIPPSLSLDSPFSIPGFHHLSNLIP